MRPPQRKIEAPRRFTDQAGRVWSVRRFVPRTPSALLSSAHADGWLTFERDDGERRRLVPALADWETLPDELLRSALAAARPVARAADMLALGWLSGSLGERAESDAAADGA